MQPQRENPTRFSGGSVKDQIIYLEIMAHYSVRGYDMQQYYNRYLEVYKG